MTQPSPQELSALTLQAIEDSTTLEELRTAELQALGRKQGWLTTALRSLKDLTPEAKAEQGQQLNLIRQSLTQAIAQKEKSLTAQSDHDPLFDPTLPGSPLAQGRLHPLSSFIREIETLFLWMGFRVEDGPQIEQEWYNFDALNIPPGHPARDMQDTFWLRDIPDMVLRTHTSNVQIHTLESQDPPLRMVSPGRVYRNEEIDATHMPVFHQYEGMVIDRDTSLPQLKWLLSQVLRELIDPDLEIRFRVAYFPFTEPSLEVDALFTAKDGSQSWLEIGGAGMVHPRVLSHAGLDPKEWNGFAFGFGIERALMIRHGITDIRLLYENDPHDLSQFQPLGSIH